MSKATDNTDSKVETPHLGEKYEGVTVSSYRDTDKVGVVRPCSASKLTELYKELPDTLEKGVNRIVGLTNDGYLVTHNSVNGRWGYVEIYVPQFGDPKPGKYTSPSPIDNPRNTLHRPHKGYGDGFIIAP